MGNYREGQEDLSSLEDWEVFGFASKQEYAEWVDYQKNWQACWEDSVSNEEDF